jgi:signal transduction histidine kinase
MGCNNISHIKYDTYNPGFVEIDSLDVNNNVITLDMKWEFYWKQLLAPKDFEDKLSTYHPAFMAPGETWDGKDISSQILTGTGYSTYRLRLKLPKSEIGKIYGIKFFLTGGPAQKIFINKNFILNLGKVGIDKESMIPTRESGYLYFPIDTELVEIIVQISNFHHSDGAFWYAPEIGDNKLLLNRIKKNDVSDSFLLGSIFMISIYQFLLYFKRRKDKSTLVFGIFCIMLFLHSISLKGDFLYEFLPHVSYKFAYVLSVIFMIYIPTYVYFLRLLYPEEFSKNLVKFSFGVNISLFIIATTIPVEIGSKMTVPGILSGLIFSLLNIFCLFKCIINKRPYAILFLITGIFFIGTAILDTLSVYRILNIPYTLLYTYTLYIFIQSFIKSDIYSKNFIKIEELSEKLILINENLEDKVKSRTIELQIQIESAENESHWKNKFITLVSHDLQSPLTTILILFESITKGDLDNNSIINKVSISKEIILNSLFMVRHLLCLSRFQYRNLQLSYSDIDIIEIIAIIENDLSSELRRKNIELNYNRTTSHIFTLDKEIVIEIIRNIILNSIKFTNQNSEISIHIQENDDFQNIYIRDYGIGFSEAQLEKLKNKSHFTSKGTNGETGFGIGLRLCYDLMELHKGHLSISSIKNEGATVCLQFPSNYNSSLIITNFASLADYEEIEKFKKSFYIESKSIKESLSIVEDIFFKNIVLSLSFSEEDIELFFSELSNLYIDNKINLYLLGDDSNFDKYQNKFKNQLINFTIYKINYISHKISGRNNSI